MLDPNRFVQERREVWRELERELDAAAAGSFKSFDVPRARRLGQLYRLTSADLIRARSETANEGMTDYLNGLVGRAYGLIYRGRKMRLSGAWTFLAFTFPARVRAHHRLIALAAGIFLLGALFGFVVEYLDSAAKYSLLPPGLDSIEDHIETQRLRAAGGGANLGVGVASQEASQITSNNIQVSFSMAFALGITAGIGTACMLFYNGLLLGMLGAIHLRHGLSLFFWAFIVPHGVIELMAIFIAGGAGFLLAQAIVAPGLYGRKEALRRLGLEGVLLVIGCAVMLVVAGLIEGFVTPQASIPHGIKLLFGLATLLFLIVWFGFNEPLLAGFGLRPPLEEEGAG